MPLYDYRCPSCGRLAVDVLTSYKQPSALMCANPDVHAAPVEMERLVCAPSFVVNGFSAKNGYNGGQTYEVKVKEKDMRVIVKS